MVAEAGSLMDQIFRHGVDLAEIGFLPGGFVEGDQAVAHGAGVYGLNRQPQADQLIDPFFDGIKIPFFFCGFPGPGDPIAGNPQRPAPGHIHVHGPSDELVHNQF